RKKYQDLLLVSSRSGSSSSSTLSLNFSADDEVDMLAERARSVPAVGQSAVSEPVNTPWNTRDLNVINPSGNQLVFTGRQTNPDPEQVGKWKTIFEKARKEG